MRIAAIGLILCALAMGCKKEEKPVDNTTPCLSSGSLDPAFAYEALTNDYQIAFTPSYKYGGYIVYHGDNFLKKRYGAKDTTTYMAKYGPDEGQTSVYGPTLVNPEAKQVDVTYNNKTYTLKNKRRLCGGDNTIGYYYYTLSRADTNSRNTGLGVVYLRQGEDFRQNLVIDFPDYEETEVNTVLSTIKKK